MEFDIVDLVMEIEEHFAIVIPDCEAERIYTVGELYLFLLRKSRHHFPNGCPTSRAFYQLRRTLTQQHEVERQGVTPSALMRDLIPAQIRGTAWPQLAKSLNLPDLPDLDPPLRVPTFKTFVRTLGWVAVGSWLLFAAFLVGEALPIRSLVFFVLFVWSGFSLIAGLLFGAAWIQGRYLERPPIPRVRDIVIRLASRHRDQDLAATPTDPHAAKLWTDLVGILSKLIRVPPNNIRPEHSWFYLAAAGETQS
jgi:hypothetical protein